MDSMLKILMATAAKDIARKIQMCIDKIQEAINPLPCVDAPFMAYALKITLETVIESMDDNQKKIFEGLCEVIQPRKKTLRMSADTVEIFKVLNEEGK